jgi:hypothetical protein
MSAETMGNIIHAVLIVGALGCLVLVGGTFWLLGWIIRAVYRAMTGRPVFQAERDSDLSDVMLSDYGDVPNTEAVHQAQRPARDFIAQPVMFPPARAEG